MRHELLKLVGGVCLGVVLACGGEPESAAPVVLMSDHFRYVISGDARNLEFKALATNQDYLRAKGESRCAKVKCGAKMFEATSARMDGGRLFLQFGAPDLGACLKVESKPWGIVFTVESVNGAVDSLTFLDIPLSLAGRPSEPFGACALSLNLITRVDQLPVLQDRLCASAEKRFGLAGAKVALVAGPTESILRLAQDAIPNASELPVCRVAGPWAGEIPFNRGSYLFNFGSLTETNVEDWIEMVRRVGFNQIDNHGGGAFFRFGDFELNRDKWPEGWESFRRIVSRLHEAGIGSIFHTYAFFIDKRSRYVTPVPDARLDAFRTFTLAEPISAEATEIAVNESTADMSTVTGFFEHNSVVLHIDDELVTFGGFSKQPPWRFTDVKRGAHGTRASAHNRGAKARHLKECFGLFVPDVDTSLFEEIAANHAEIVNRCGFDGIYLDAIDGSSILRGPDECWYWASKFVTDIQKRLTKPAGMEMSAMWHHFWQYRTRWQAWDYPQRGHKRFIDLHADAVNGGLMLPLHLGWWSFQSFDPPQIEPTYPDVMEHLGARLIGWNAGISLTAPLDAETLRRKPLFERAAAILRTCEELRRSNAFDATARTKLSNPAKEFAMTRNNGGKVEFREVCSCTHTVAADEPWSAEWVVTNLFAAQPVRFRIEVLSSAGRVEGGNSVLLADLGGSSSRQWRATNARGVSFAVVGDGGTHGFATIVATNSGEVPRNAAWARLERRFEPPLNAADQKALRFEVEGDGSGALLAVRIESPRHMCYGAIADRYLMLDFKGRRNVALVETESERWSDFVWQDGKHAYNVYRETINFGAIESVSVWLQNLPANQSVRVSLGPVYGVPLLQVPVENIRLSVNGQTVLFPATIKSGSWIEGNGVEDCMVYGPNGETLGKAVPQGEWPKLRNGVNQLRLTCQSGEEAAARVRVRVVALGDAL